MELGMDHHIQRELSRARAIAHVDLDAFYCQVEEKLDPSLKGTPNVVVQYNPRDTLARDLRTLRPDEPRRFPGSNGGIIAVSYAARAFGVKRQMTGQEAKKLCPTLNIVQVPVAHGKADLGIYREAGAAVAAVLSRMCVCERASIDEVYLDVTEEASKRLADATALGAGPPAPGTWQGLHVVGSELQEDGAAVDEEGTDCQELPLSPSSTAQRWWGRPASQWAPNEALLAAGAQVVWELRMAVKEELGFSCSAGVSHYKILAKLGSGLHKPMQQTNVPACAVADLLRDLPLTKLRGLGGDFGHQVKASLGATTCGELWAVPAAKLEALFGKKGPWVARLAWGIDDVANDIKPRLLPKQISCGKTFRGQDALTDLAAVGKWLHELASEVVERSDDDRAAHKRMPRLLTVAMGNEPSGQALTNYTRSCPLGRPDVPEDMTSAALGLIRKWASERPGYRITSMYLSASGFVSAPTGSSSITRYLGAPTSQQPHAPMQPPSSQQGPQITSTQQGQHPPGPCESRHRSAPVQRVQPWFRPFAAHRDTEAASPAGPSESSPPHTSERGQHQQEAWDVVDMYDEDDQPDCNEPREGVSVPECQPSVHLPREPRSQGSPSHTHPHPHPPMFSNITERMEGHVIQAQQHGHGAGDAQTAQSATVPDLLLPQSASQSQAGRPSQQDSICLPPSSLSTWLPGSQQAPSSQALEGRVPGLAPGPAPDLTPSPAPGPALISGWPAVGPRSGPGGPAPGFEYCPAGLIEAGPEDPRHWGPQQGGPRHGISTGHHVPQSSSHTHKDVQLQGEGEGEGMYAAVAAAATSPLQREGQQGSGSIRQQTKSAGAPATTSTRDSSVAQHQQLLALQGGHLDPAVLATLPWAIQQELRAAMGQGQGSSSQAHGQGHHGIATQGKGQKKRPGTHDAQGTRSIKSFFKPKG